MSTILLVFPELGLFGDYELFEAYCERLVRFDMIYYDCKINVDIHGKESKNFDDVNYVTVIMKVIIILIIIIFNN